MAETKSTKYKWYTKLLEYEQHLVHFRLPATCVSTICSADFPEDERFGYDTSDSDTVRSGATAGAKAGPPTHATQGTAARMVPPRVPPMHESYSQSTYEDKEGLFFSRIARLHDIMISRNPPENFRHATDFLNEAIILFDPQRSADPFYMFGIDLYCVKDAKDIYKSEHLKEECVEVTVDETASLVLDFLKDLADKDEELNEYPDKNYLGRILSTMLNESRFSEVSSRTRQGNHIEKLKKETAVKSAAAKDLWTFLNVFLACPDTERVLERIDNLKEQQLEELVRHLLKLDGECFRTGTMVLHQFENVLGGKSQEQKYTPDLVYAFSTCCYMIAVVVKTEDTRKLITKEIKCIDPTTEPPFMMTKEFVPKKKEEDLVSQSLRSNSWLEISVDTCLLWQVFEQVFGMMMDTYHDVTNKTVVFQAGLVIINGKCRIMVLAMTAETYKTLFKKKKALDTVILLLQFARKHEMWCRYYIDSTDYNLCDIVQLAKYSFINFCVAI